VRIQITGVGPALESYLLYFGRRAVAGGSVDGSGRFQATLLIGKERAGTYPITVRQRLSDRPLLIQTFRLGTAAPVSLPPSFSNGSPVNLICTVPEATPTVTVGPVNPVASAP
jgi:hypothetical protein